jgi:hypothetical protein
MSNWKSTDELSSTSSVLNKLVIDLFKTFELLIGIFDGLVVSMASVINLS